MALTYYSRVTLKIISLYLSNLLTYDMQSKGYLDPCAGEVILFIQKVFKAANAICEHFVPIQLPVVEVKEKPHCYEGEECWREVCVHNIDDICQ